ncbi:hypothetical protein [Streptosporangium lutulentum]|uniref:hypothetical protein n=1 Tax=Streptosporangium lutulentum TaxID=1461250 RepID=UPI003625FF06
MAGTFAIDSAQTFQFMIFMGCEEKNAFGSTDQEKNAQGIPKWSLQFAVTFHPTPGMKAISEVIAVTITQHGHPADGVPPGTPVELVGLRLGISSPEKNDKGSIRGGKPWYQASGIRPAQVATRRGGKADEQAA